VAVAPDKILLGAFVAFAAVWDLKYRRIPNWLTIPALALAFLLRFALHGAAGLWEAAGGFAAALAVTIPLFLLGALGGGDVKLMAATGAFLGVMPFITLFVINAVAGGVAAIALAAARGRLADTLRSTGRILSSGGKPEYNIHHPKALTLPRGAIWGACALLMLAFSR